MKSILSTALLTAFAPLAAFAAPANLDFQAGSPISATSHRNIVEGGNGVLNYQAWNTIIGVTSTGTVASGGNPIYQAPRPQYNGVVSLIMSYSTGSFICSGTLVSPTAIVTAAHCVSDGFGTAGPLTTTAFFSNSANLDNVVHTDLTSSSRAVSQIVVNPGYTGQVIDQNDIAVLRLGAAAPAFATISQMNFNPISNGDGFNVAGYGGRSATGGSVGANLGTGRLRQGNNNYDFTFGDAAWGGFWFDPNPSRPGSTNFFGTAQIGQSWVSDFDNGLAANDASCLLGTDFGTNVFCNLGVGAREVGVAGGDSGGPQFVDGKLTSVTSYGVSFGASYGDTFGGLNSSFGEFSGYVPLSIHQSFIMAAIPEPSSWAMLIAGVGLVGAAVRRRREGVAAS